MEVAELHAVERVVRTLAHDIARDVHAHTARSAEGVPAEREEQWQIDLAGSASGVPAAIIVDLDFQHAFITAIGRRMSQLDRPQTHFGFELTSVTDAVTRRPSVVVPALHAAVVGWTFDGLNIAGARVAITAYAPGAQLNFRGVAHATFQGYGVVRDHQPDEDA